MKYQLCTIISEYCSPCSIFSFFPFSCPQLSWLENPKRNPSSKYQSHEDFKNSQKSWSCHVNFKLEFQPGSTSFWVHQVLRGCQYKELEILKKLKSTRISLLAPHHLPGVPVNSVRYLQVLIVCNFSCRLWMRHAYIMVNISSSIIYKFDISFLDPSIKLTIGFCELRMGHLYVMHMPLKS